MVPIILHYAYVACKCLGSANSTLDRILNPRAQTQSNHRRSIPCSVKTYYYS